MAKLEYEVRNGSGTERHIYLRDWNVRVATFEPSVSEADKDEIARLLREGWDKFQGVRPNGTKLTVEPHTGGKVRD